jgi:hypothetical protein
VSRGLFALFSFGRGASQSIADIGSGDATIDQKASESAALKFRKKN